jgi:uncharacterized protein YdaU (DUF1376 family)
MARPPAIQWYYKQWLGDNKVLAMDWDATGMHHHLLMVSIQEEPPGSIPNDMATIRRWLRNPPDSVWRRVHPQIFAAWSLRDGRWFNSGMVETMERQNRYKERYEGGTKTTANFKKRKDKNNEDQSNLFKEEISENLRVQVEEIGHLHPKNKHMKSLAIPLAQQEAIAAAIKHDGFDIVLSGTKSLAERVAEWTAPELRYIPNPVKFYLEAEYLRNPVVWERRFESGREECTRHPNSGLTQWGTCWACYSEECSSDRQSA